MQPSVVTSSCDITGSLEPDVAAPIIGLAIGYWFQIGIGSAMALWACTEFVLFSAYELLIEACLLAKFCMYI